MPSTASRCVLHRIVVCPLPHRGVHSTALWCPLHRIVVVLLPPCVRTRLGYTEYRSKEKWHNGWQPVDERTQKGFTMEARLAGIHECFSIPASDDEGQYMTSTAILTAVKRKAGSALPRCNAATFGRILANTEGLIRRRTNRGSEYLVAPKE